MNEKDVKQAAVPVKTEPEPEKMSFGEIDEAMKETEAKIATTAPEKKQPEKPVTPVTPAQEVKKPAKTGVVVNCTKLRIRKQPTLKAAIVAEIPVGTEVQIFDEQSTRDFYRVRTAKGTYGFCVNEFIDIKA